MKLTDLRTKIYADGAELSKTVGSLQLCEHHAFVVGNGLENLHFPFDKEKKPMRPL